MTDGAGSAIDGGAWDYAPYGVPLSTGGPGSLTPYAYTGQWLDADTGLQYHRARWLNCATANWLSIDPVFDFPGNFGSRYGYGGGRPGNSVDASGTLTLSECASVARTVNILAGVALASTVLPHFLAVGPPPSSDWEEGLFWRTITGVKAKIGPVTVSYGTSTTFGRLGVLHQHYVSVSFDLMMIARLFWRGSGVAASVEATDILDRVIVAALDRLPGVPLAAVAQITGGSALSLLKGAEGIAMKAFGGGFAIDGGRAFTGGAWPLDSLKHVFAKGDFFLGAEGAWILYPNALVYDLKMPWAVTLHADAQTAIASLGLGVILGVEWYGLPNVPLANTASGFMLSSEVGIGLSASGSATIVTGGVDLGVMKSW